MTLALGENPWGSFGGSFLCLCWTEGSHPTCLCSSGPSLVLRKHSSRVTAPHLDLPQDRGWGVLRHLRARALRRRWILMGFEHLAPPGSSAKLSFGSSACSGPGLTRFNPRGKSSLMPVGRSLPRSRLRGGERQRPARTEGPVEGPGEQEFILKLVWLTCRHNAAQHLPLLTLHTVPGSGSRWLRAAGARLRLLASALSLLGGGEQFINLFGTLHGFLAVCSSRVWAVPAPAAGRRVLHKPMFLPSWRGRAGMSLLCQHGGVGGLLIKFLQCSVIRNSVFESLLEGFSIVLSLFISTGKDGAVVGQGFAGEKRKPGGNSCSGLWQPCSDLGLRLGVASGCVPEITYELMSQKCPETCRLAFLLPVQTRSCSTKGLAGIIAGQCRRHKNLLWFLFFLLWFPFFAV